MVSQLKLNYEINRGEGGGGRGQGIEGLLMVLQGETNSLFLVWQVISNDINLLEKE